MNDTTKQSKPRKIVDELDVAKRINALLKQLPLDRRGLVLQICGTMAKDFPEPAKMTQGESPFVSLFPTAERVKNTNEES
jgi:hypothetical protein